MAEDQIPENVRDYLNQGGPSPFPEMEDVTDNAAGPTVGQGTDQDGDPDNPPNLPGQNGQNGQKGAATPDLTPAIQRLLDRAGEFDTRNEKLMGQQRQLTSEMVSQMDADRRDLAATPQPQFQQTPQEPKAQLGQGMMEFMQVATVLGALAGGRGRANTTAALNAFSGAVKGFTQGKQQVFEDKMQEWKAAVERVKTENQAKLDQYDLIWKNKKLSMDQKLAEMKIVAAQYSDEIVYNTAEQKNYTSLAMMLQRQQQWMASFEKSSAALELSGQKFGNQLKVQQEVRDAGKDVAQMIATGQVPPDKWGSARMQPYVIPELKKLGFNDSKALLEWRAANKQVSFLNGPQMSKIDNLSTSVLSTIKDIREDAEQLKLGGVRVINQLELTRLLQADANSSVAQVAQDYITKLAALKSEGANLESGGYAPLQEAWLLVDKQISADMGYKQLETSLNAMERVINYRVGAIANFRTLGPAAGNRYTGSEPRPPAAEPQNVGGGAPNDEIERLKQKYNYGN